ncbi:MAG: hypothetical protein GYA62_09855 [Bacteroidales bacterium]|nr:hypothetical protein [Bacteroidales bacterium]
MDRNNMRKQIDQLLKSSESQLLDSSNFKHTVFTPVLDIKINTTENYVYCSSFQNAWSNFRSDVFKDTLEISAADSVEIIMKLEEALKQKTMLDDEYQVSLAGSGGDGIVSKINAELMEKFKNNHFDVEIKTDEVLIYSRFKKTYELEYPLDEFLDRGLSFSNRSGGSVTVKSFGFQDNIVGDRNCEIKINQIELLYCKNDRFWNEVTFRDRPFCYPDGVILRFKLKGSDDEFIMATDEFITHANDTENTLLKMYNKINDLVTNKKFNYFNLSVFYENGYTNEEFFGSIFKNFSEKVKKIKIEDIRSDTKQEYLEKFRIKAGLDEIEFKMLCKYIDTMDERMNKYINPLHEASCLKIPKLKFNCSINYPFVDNFMNNNIIKTVQEIDMQFKFSTIPDEIMMYENPFSVRVFNEFFSTLYIKKKNEPLPYFMACINNHEILTKEYYYMKKDAPELKTTPGDLIYINNKPVIYYKILNKHQFIDNN